jgi:hypothetical protein
MGRAYRNVGPTKGKVPLIYWMSTHTMKKAWNGL